MADHNALTQAGNILKALRNFTGLGNDEEGVVRLSETLTPVVDQWAQPDAAFLRGDRLLTLHLAQPAGGAATTTFVGLKNNSSNILVIVTGALGSPGAGTVRIMMVPNTAAAIVAAAEVGPGAARDTRLWFGSGSAVGRVPMIRSNPAAPGVGGSQFSLLGGNVDFLHPLVVSPGYAVVIETITENTPLTGVIQYREKLMLPGEFQRP